MTQHVQAYQPVITNNWVRTIVKQPDGKILVGGNLTRWNGYSVGRIVRLNENGSLDSSFMANIGTGANSVVHSIHIQSDGKILIWGFFSTWNGATVNRIVRLNADGTRDTGFTSNIDLTSSSSSLGIFLTPSQKIVVMGRFTTWGGSAAMYVVRLNSDGTRDNTFNSGIPNLGINFEATFELLVQSDEKVVLSFVYYDMSVNLLRYFVRLNSNGTLDTSFNSNVGSGPNDEVDSLALQSDGKIIVGGALTTWNGITVGRILRLNSDGTRDVAFSANIGTGPSNRASGISIQSDGKILVGTRSTFSTWNGASVNNIVRLNSDGTRDTVFTTNNGSGPNNSIFVIKEINSSIYLGGSLTTFNGQTSSYFSVLSSSGSLDTTQPIGWRTVSMPYTKVAGVWKAAKAIYNRVAGKWYSSFLQGGINDYGFTDYDIASRSLAAVGAVGGPAIAVQSDGKILVCGAFTTWNGTTVGRIVRLNSDGTVDINFTTNAGTAASGTVYAIALQSDGKILVGGLFATWNGTTVNNIVRLNSDGTRDTAFTTNAGTAANSNIYAIALQPDGKILVGGGFTTWNGTTVGRIVRLNSDGTRDTAFTTNSGTGANSVIYAITRQSDGKILVGGVFTTWNGTTVNYIVRLNSDGTRDTAFTTNAGTAANSTILSAIIQSDGKIIIGGGFTTWNGTTVNRIVRLNSDGTRDTAFTTNTGTGASGDVYAIAIQSDNKIVVGGDFTTWSGTAINRIVRLNSDGTRDTAFSTNVGAGVNNTVYVIYVQSDNKIIVGGNFTTWNNISSNRIIRVNSDGTIPSSTAIDGVMPIGSNGTVGGAGGPAIALQSDGKILVGGNFSTWSGTIVFYIVRLNSDGTRDTAFTTNAGTAANGTVYAIAVQSNGKILVGGNFTAWNGATVGYVVRLNADGTRDTTFTTNNGTGANTPIYAIAVQSDGKILVGGNFTTWNGTTVNRIVRLNSDGTRDTAFTTNTGTGASGDVYAIAIQSDNKIVVGGLFATWNGTTVNYIVRLNSAGTRDTAFTTNAGTAANSTILSAIIQSDGKIIIGGGFTTWNGTTVNRIVRLNSDGTRDTAFTTNVGTGASGSIYAITRQSDGKIVLGGLVNTWNGTTVGRIVRLNSDGTRDTAFTTNAGTGFNSAIYGITVQSDGKILVGGNFTGFNNINRSYFARIGGELAI